MVSNYFLDIRHTPYTCVSHSSLGYEYDLVTHPSSQASLLLLGHTTLTSLRF